jgi:hypothetical protein
MNRITAATDHDTFDWILDPVGQTRTYRNILYLLLAFPMGLCYFIFLTVGLSLGVGLMVIFIGIPILFCVLTACSSLGAFERNLARSLLDVNIPPPAVGPSVSGLFAKTKVLLQDPLTWKSLAFLMVRFPFGIISFVLLVVCLSISLSFTLAPVFYYVVPLHDSFQILLDRPDSAVGEAFLSFLGVVLLIASMHLMNGIALVWGRFAQVMLGSGPLVRG